jgi:uncharacterized membrane protein YgcG
MATLCNPFLALSLSDDEDTRRERVPPGSADPLEPPPPFTLSDLPDDLLRHILRSSSINLRVRDLLAFGRTCRRFRTVVKEGGLLRRLSVRLDPRPKRTRLLPTSAPPTLILNPDKQSPLLAALFGQTRTARGIEEVHLDLACISRPPGETDRDTLALPAAAWRRLHLLQPHTARLGLLSYDINNEEAEENASMSEEEEEELTQQTLGVDLLYASSRLTALTALLTNGSELPYLQLERLRSLRSLTFERFSRGHAPDTQSLSINGSNLAPALLPLTRLESLTILSVPGWLGMDDYNRSAYGSLHLNPDEGSLGALSALTALVSLTLGTLPSDAIFPPLPPSITELCLTMIHRRTLEPWYSSHHWGLIPVEERLEPPPPPPPPPPPVAPDGGVAAAPAAGPPPSSVRRLSICYLLDCKDSERTTIYDARSCALRLELTPRSLPCAFPALEEFIFTIPNATKYNTADLTDLFEAAPNLQRVRLEGMGSLTGRMVAAMMGGAWDRPGGGGEGGGAGSGVSGGDGGGGGGGSAGAAGQGPTAPWPCISLEWPAPAP